MSWDTNSYRLPLKYGLGKNSFTALVLARSAVFSSQVYRGPCKRPRYMAATRLASAVQFEVDQLSGWQLDQADGELWHQIVRKAVLDADGDVVSLTSINVSPGQLMSATARTKGGKTRALLASSLQRLVEATFEIRSGEKVVPFQPLAAATRVDTDCGLVQVALGTGLPELLQQWSFVLLKQAERIPLLHDPLACALHAYFASHTSPYPIKSETLKRLLGRESMQGSKWRLALVAALQRLHVTTGWTCSLRSDDKVAVIRGPACDKVTIVRSQGGAPGESPPSMPGPEYVNTASMDLEQIRAAIDI